MRTRSTYTLLELPPLPASARQAKRGPRQVILFAGLLGLMKTYPKFTDRQVFKGSQPHQLHKMEMDEDLQSSDDVVNEGVERGLRYLKGAIRKRKEGKKSRTQREESEVREEKEREEREREETRGEEKENVWEESDAESDDIFEDVYRLSVFEEEIPQDYPTDQPNPDSHLASTPKAFLSPDHPPTPTTFQLLTQPPSQSPTSLPTQPPSQKCLQPTQALTESPSNQA